MEEAAQPYCQAEGCYVQTYCTQCQSCSKMMCAEHIPVQAHKCQPPTDTAATSAAAAKKPTLANPISLLHRKNSENATAAGSAAASNETAPTLVQTSSRSIFSRSREMDSTRPLSLSSPLSSSLHGSAAGGGEPGSPSELKGTSADLMRHGSASIGGRGNGDIPSFSREPSSLGLGRMRSTDGTLPNYTNRGLSLFSSELPEYLRQGSGLQRPSSLPRSNSLPRSGSLSRTVEEGHVGTTDDVGPTLQSATNTPANALGSAPLPTVKFDTPTSSHMIGLPQQKYTRSKSRELAALTGSNDMYPYAHVTTSGDMSTSGASAASPPFTNPFNLPGMSAPRHQRANSLLLSSPTQQNDDMLGPTAGALASLATPSLHSGLSLNSPPPTSTSHTMPSSHPLAHARNQFSREMDHTPSPPPGHSGNHPLSPPSSTMQGGQHHNNNSNNSSIGTKRMRNGDNGGGMPSHGQQQHQQQQSYMPIKVEQMKSEPLISPATKKRKVNQAGPSVHIPSPREGSTLHLQTSSSSTPRFHMPAVAGGTSTFDLEHARMEHILSLVRTLTGTGNAQQSNSSAFDTAMALSKDLRMDDLVDAYKTHTQSYTWLCESHQVRNMHAAQAIVTLSINAPERHLADHAAAASSGSPGWLSGNTAASSSSSSLQTPSSAAGRSHSPTPHPMRSNVFHLPASSRLAPVTHPFLPSASRVIDTLIKTMHMNELEIAGFSIYLDRIESEWLLQITEKGKDIAHCVKLLHFIAYLVKTSFNTQVQCMMYLPYLVGMYPDFSTHLSRWLHEKSTTTQGGGFQLALPPVLLNHRFNLIRTFKQAQA